MILLLLLLIIPLIGMSLIVVALMIEAGKDDPDDWDILDKYEK